MTRRLELYDWPKESRECAQEMYKIARTLLLEARWLRREAKLPSEAMMNRKAAKLILSQIRMGRDVDVFYHRKLIRESVERSLAAQAGQPTSLGGHLFDLMCIKGTGLDRPEFDEKTLRKATEL